MFIAIGESHQSLSTSNLAMKLTVVQPLSIPGALLWYAALATMLQEEGVPVPYFPLPRQDA